MDWSLILKQHLQALIRINTTNPPGGETAAALYVAEQLQAAGIEHEVVEPTPGRGSIVARLRGDGSARPLLLLAHLDVVPAVAEDWSHDPFGGEEVDGVIWGRGAVDIKNLVATWLTLMVKLKHDGAKLKRDIIFAATADEEAGGHYGMKWIVDNRWDLVDCEYCLNEGGGNALVLGGKTYFTYQAGEKTSCRITLTARGTAGHASIPTPGNPLYLLAEALYGLSTAKMPCHRTVTAEAFLSTLAEGFAGVQGAIFKWAIESGQVLRVVDLAVKSPFERAGLRAMLTNTAVPTMANIGQKLNVIPSQASAELDGRILPGFTKEDLVAELKAVLPRHIEVSAEGKGVATESPISTPLASVIKDVIAVHSPGAKAIPFLSPGATDARYLRPKGVVVYGFGPMLPGEKVQLAHGVDEHITLKSLEFGFKVLEDTILRIGQ